MARYKFAALDQKGNEVTGELEGESTTRINSLLSERGYIPLSVTPVKESNESALSRLQQRLTQIPPQEMILFTKQFRTMLRSGVPILRVLEILEEQNENPKLKHVIKEILEAIKEGSNLYTAFEKFPNVFSPLFTSMIQAGEISGTLPEVMERLIYILEHENKIRSDIKSALQYPIIVMIFLGIAFVVLLMFVMPKFITIFHNAGLDLPIPTLICDKLYTFLTHYWHVMGIGFIVSVFSLRAYLKTKPGILMRDTLVLKIPVLGTLLQKSAMSRFSSIFSILQSSGVAVLESMQILTGTIGNAAISGEFERIQELMKEGKGISSPLKSARYFTPMVINMVAIGEESGNLDEMLKEISIHYDAEVEFTMHQLSEAIGPLLTIGLAGVVGFFALAIFLPMWDLTKMVH